jgi:hypothetical protein
VRVMSCGPRKNTAESFCQCWSPITIRQPRSPTKERTNIGENWSTLLLLARLESVKILHRRLRQVDTIDILYTLDSASNYSAIPKLKP